MLTSCAEWFHQHINQLHAGKAGEASLQSRWNSRKVEMLGLVHQPMSALNCVPSSGIDPHQRSPTAAPLGCMPAEIPSAFLCKRRHGAVGGWHSDLRHEALCGMTPCRPHQLGTRLAGSCGDQHMRAVLLGLRQPLLWCLCRAQQRGASAGSAPLGHSMCCAAAGGSLCCLPGLADLQGQAAPGGHGPQVLEEVPCS